MIIKILFYNKGMNGILIYGKIYEVVEKDNSNPCIECALTDDCGIYGIIDFCIAQGNSTHFHYSQELTDKLNS